MGAGKATGPFRRRPAKRLVHHPGSNRLHTQNGAPGHWPGGEFLVFMVRMPKLVDQIFVRRMDRDCEVCRERPWRSGPDHDRSFARERTGPNSEIDVDRRVGAILVLDLRFREGSLRTGAPENRFLALVHKVSLHKTRENAKDNRLIRVIKRQVRMIPIAENPKSFELAPLDVDIFASVGFGTFPNFQWGETSGFFDHLEFDR